MNTPFNPDNYLNADELACYLSKGDAAAVCAGEAQALAGQLWAAPP